MFNLRFILLCVILAGLLMARNTASPIWQPRADVLLDSIIIIWAVSLFNILLLGNGLGRLLGIRPRNPLGLLGIPFSPLLHRDIPHLVANTVPFLVSGWLVLVQSGLRTNAQGDGSFYTLTVTILLIGGLGTWLFGRHAIHLGISGLIFGYIGFLLASGYGEQTSLTVVIAIVVLVMYGAQLWSMLPNASDKTVSWEGHLFGFIGGIVAGFEPDWLAQMGTMLNNLTQ